MDKDEESDTDDDNRMFSVNLSVRDVILLI